MIYGQDFKVLEAKRAFKINGDKIRQGDSLNKEDSIVIKEKGILTLDINYPRKLTMETGQYRLDSLIEDLKFRYARHKRLHTLLKTKDLEECKFAYKLFRVPGSNKHYEADRISISDHKIDTDNPDLMELNISWENPDKNYRGKYLVILQEAFGQELLMNIIETSDFSASISLAKYDEQFMQYSIKAEDCRSSLKRKIKLPNY